MKFSDINKVYKDVYKEFEIDEEDDLLRQIIFMAQEMIQARIDFSIKASPNDWQAYARSVDLNSAIDKLGTVLWDIRDDEIVSEQYKLAVEQIGREEFLSNFLYLNEQIHVKDILAGNCPPNQMDIDFLIEEYDFDEWFMYGLEDLRG